MNLKVSGIHAARTSRPRPEYLRVVPDPTPSYDYDAAYRMIAAVQRAVASPDFHAGVLAGYVAAGLPSMAEKFTAAVEEQREFAALDDEDDDLDPLDLVKHAPLSRKQLDRALCGATTGTREAAWNYVTCDDCKNGTTAGGAA